MIKKLLLFCSSNYTNINKDLINNKFELFDEVKLLDENDLDDYILSFVNSYIENYGARGYGFWIWKPYIILQELNKLSDGDILVYLDMHCKLDNLANKFDEILNELNKQSIIFGNSGNISIEYTTKELLKYIEKSLNYKFDRKILNKTFGVEAGILFIKKNNFSINFIKEWLDLMINAGDIITNNYDSNKQYKKFKYFRHDQSLVNLLYIYHKLNFIDELSWANLHINTHAN